MTIELDNLIDLREKIDDAGNLIGMQESELLDVHNAVVEHRVAKTNETKKDTALRLNAAADLSGERAASLNRATGKVLADLHTSVNDLMTESDNDEADSYRNTIDVVHNMLVQGLLKYKDGDDLSFVEAATDMLYSELHPELQDNLEADNAQ